MPPKHQQTSSSHHKTQSQIPKFYIFWIIISSFIIIYECFFLLLRPDTMKGGQLFSYFSSFDTYIQIDPLFGDTQNWFVTILVLFNFIQITLNILGLVLYFAGPKTSTKNIGVGIVLFVAASSFYKTLIFLAYDFYYFNWEYGNKVNIVFVYLLPNVCWVVFPLVGMIKIFMRLVDNSQIANDIQAKKNK